MRARGKTAVGNRPQFSVAVDDHGGGLDAYLDAVDDGVRTRVDYKDAVVV